MKDYELDADLSFLLGKSLEQVCFGSYQILFNFSEDVSLSAESRILLTTQNEVFGITQPYTEPGGLLRLLGAEVVGVQAEQNGDLSLEFSNQLKLKVLNDNVEYESYQITNGSSSIVV